MTDSLSTTAVRQGMPNASEVEAAAHERELLRQAQQGDSAAFEALVDRFQLRVYGLARRIVGQGQDAEDVTQQTFLSIIEHIDRFRGESAVATWILRIATNHALKVLRKRRGLPTVPLEAVADPDDSYATLPHPGYIARWRDNPEDLAQRAEVRQLVEQALTDLDDKYRVVFALRDIEGLSVKETAEALGLSEANVKVRLLRARLQLRERLTLALGEETTQVFPTHGRE
jgi:RNA polymerase sigma-70 factor (ECF subfamily)